MSKVVIRLKDRFIEVLEKPVGVEVEIIDVDPPCSEECPRISQYEAGELIPAVLKTEKGK